MLARRLRDEYVELGPDREQTGLDWADVVVCASGNLALVYLTHRQGRLTLEEISGALPDLTRGLAAHEGIGFVLVRSQRHGPLVLGRAGVHHLRDGRVDGADPLAGFGAHAADHLRRLDAFPHVGDLVVNSAVDPESGETAAFEELVGSHGGMGGPQTAAFLVFPAELPLDDRPIIAARAVNRVLRRWVATVSEPGTSELEPARTAVERLDPLGVDEPVPRDEEA